MLRQGFTCNSRCGTCSLCFCTGLGELKLDSSQPNLQDPDLDPPLPSPPPALPAQMSRALKLAWGTSQDFLTASKAALQQTYMVYQAASNEQCNGQMGIPGLSCGLPPPQFQLGRQLCSAA